ncbi:MAG: site-specific DNA-methyltransferase [Nanoarchaeota archaeon]
MLEINKIHNIEVLKGQDLTNRASPVKHELNKIYCGDCVKILSLFSDKYFDLCITDIPFNVGWKYGEYDDNLSDDKYYQNCIGWFTAIERVSKRTIVKIPTKFSYIVLPAFHKTLKYKWTIIQYSPNTTSHGAFNLHLYTQYLVSDGEGKTPKLDFFRNTINNIKTEHPAEMPIQPIQKLIDWFTEPNDLILDPFMGSGTTGEACLKLNRKFVGVELNPKFVEMANKRLKYYIEQTHLS